MGFNGKYLIPNAVRESASLRYLSALLSAQGACIEHLFSAYCFLLFMGHELMDGAASQSPLGGGCVGP
jgi:hypothetical protein